MSDWTTATLDEIGQIFDGPHATPSRQTVGPFFLNIASLSAGRLDLSLSDHVSTEDFARWTRRVTPRADDLLFSYETRLGEAALMPADIEACLGRRMALIRPKRDRVDPRFLLYLYLYLAPRFQSMIEQNTVHGATVNRIPLNRMGTWVVSLPSVPEQQAIAEVLGALDDKIAANTALAATARELGVAMLRIQAPMTALGNVVLHHKRQINPASMDEAVVEHYSLPAFDDGRGPEMVPPSSIKSSKFAVDTSAVLVSKLNPQTPRVWPINAGHGAPRLASTEFLVLEPFVSNPWVMWGLLSQPSFTAALQGLVAGTSGSHQRVRPEEVLATSVLDPRLLQPQLLTDVEEILAPIGALLTENVSLAATRDALLPPLMSGRLGVRDAEAAASEAGV